MATVIVVIIIVIAVIFAIRGCMKGHGGCGGDCEHCHKNSGHNSCKGNACDTEKGHR